MRAEMTTVAVAFVVFSGAAFLLGAVSNGGEFVLALPMIGLLSVLTGFITLGIRGGLS